MQILKLAAEDVELLVDLLGSTQPEARHATWTFWTVMNTTCFSWTTAIGKKSNPDIWSFMNLPYLKLRHVFQQHEMLHHFLGDPRRSSYRSGLMALPRPSTSQQCAAVLRRATPARRCWGVTGCDPRIEPCDLKFVVFFLFFLIFFNGVLCFFFFFSMVVLYFFGCVLTWQNDMFQKNMHNEMFEKCSLPFLFCWGSLRFPLRCLLNLPRTLGACRTADRFRWATGESVHQLIDLHTWWSYVENVSQSLPVVPSPSTFEIFWTIWNLQVLKQDALTKSDQRPLSQVICDDSYPSLLRHPPCSSRTLLLVDPPLEPYDLYMVPWLQGPKIHLKIQLTWKIAYSITGLVSHRCMMIHTQRRSMTYIYIYTMFGCIIFMYNVTMYPDVSPTVPFLSFWAESTWVFVRGLEPVLVGCRRKLAQLHGVGPTRKTMVQTIIAGWFCTQKVVKPSEIQIVAFKF